NGNFSASSGKSMTPPLLIVRGSTSAHSTGRLSSFTTPSRKPRQKSSRKRCSGVSYSGWLSGWSGEYHYSIQPRNLWQICGRIGDKTLLLHHHPSKSRQGSACISAT